MNTSQPTSQQQVYYPEQWGVHYLIAWKDKDGRIYRRLATMAEWKAAGGKQ